MKSHIMPTYRQLPIAPVRGEGSWLYTEDKRKYLDAYGGIAVIAIGHSHPRWVECLQNQLQQLVHIANVLTIPAQEELTAKLSKLGALDSIFLGNTGAEANEFAIKIARLHGHSQGIENPSIIVMDKSFHGRTLATLSASGSRKVQAGFEPLVQGFVRAPFGDIEAIRAISQNPSSNVVAVLVEPIQGEAGIRVPYEGYLKDLQKICNKNNWLFMLDEVQSGIGRTGCWFGYQNESQVKPDVLTLAKALGGGLPIGATAIDQKWLSLINPGCHGTTMGGNPLSCASALCTLEIIEEEGLIENSRKLGNELKSQFSDAFKNTQEVTDVRGQGLWLGIELNRPARDIQLKAAENGLLVTVASETVIRLAPPLNLKQDEAEILLNTLIKSVKECI